MSHKLIKDATAALEDIAGVVARLDEKQFDAVALALLRSEKIVLHGLGREGLQMKGLAMRLYHLGFDAHVLGEMTTPPVGAGDLLFVSAGPGDFATITSLLKIAREAGAQTVVVTAQAESATAIGAHHVLVIAAQTMANDQGSNLSILPMGSLYEASLMLVFELLALKLRDMKDETAASMRSRHTNLE